MQQRSYRIDEKRFLSKETEAFVHYDSNEPV